MTSTNNKRGSKAKDMGTKVRELVAEHLGVETDDISIEDSFSNDLHMGPTELSELIEKLESMEVDTTKIDLTEIETISELIETLD
jgi:acyl carrier protein